MNKSASTVLLGAAFALWLGLPVEAAKKKYCFFEMESICPGRQPARGSKIRKPKPAAKSMANPPVPTPKPGTTKTAIPIPKAKPAKAATVANAPNDAAAEAPKSETVKTPESAPAPKPEVAEAPEPTPAPETKAKVEASTEPAPPEPEPKPDTAKAPESAPPEPEPKPEVAATTELTPPEPEPKPDLAQAPEPPAPEPKPTITEPTPPASGPQQAAAEAGTACRAELTKLGASFTQPASASFGTCTVENAVQLDSIKVEGQTVDLLGKPTFNCTFAKKFTTWVSDVAVPVVEAQEGKALAALSTGPGVECRNRNGDSTGKISEHASGNAVDIDTIILADKSRIAISQVSNTADPHFRMLMALRTSGCGYFTTVLGPGSNAAHASHYHFDLGVHGKSGNYRICE